jgi:hypothetical protein
MNILKKRIAATDEKLNALKEARKVADKARHRAYKQSKANRERKAMLVGEVVLRRVEQGLWAESEFRSMMDDALSRGTDRALFDLD